MSNQELSTEEMSSNIPIPSLHTTAEIRETQPQWFGIFQRKPQEIKLKAESIEVPPLEQSIENTLVGANTKQLDIAAPFAFAIRRLKISIADFVMRTRQPLTTTDMRNVYNDSVLVGKSVAKLSISLLVPTIKLIRGIGSGIVQAFAVPINRRRANSIG